MGRLILCLVAILCACSGSTEVNVTIDFLSFFDPAELTLDLWIPQLIDVSVYFLPGIQIDLTQQGPDEESVRGALITVPQPEIPQEASFISAEFFTRFSISNLDSGNSLSPVGFSVFVAPESATDIYSSGEELLGIPTSPINAGATEDVSVQILIPADTLYGIIIQEGAFRIGVKVSLPASVSADIHVSLSIDEMWLRLSALPFSFIP